jgi:hypothetical protein
MKDLRLGTFLLLVLLAGTTGCGRASEKEETGSSSDDLKCRQYSASGEVRRCLQYDPSLIELLVRIESYRNRPVAVTGVLSNEHEDRALYLNRDAYDRMALREALLLNLTEDQKAEYKGLSGKLVDVLGIVGTTGTNELGYAGELHSIKSVTENNFRRGETRPPAPPTQGGR